MVTEFRTLRQLITLLAKSTPRKLQADKISTCQSNFQIQPPAVGAARPVSGLQALPAADPKWRPCGEPRGCQHPVEGGRPRQPQWWGQAQPLWGGLRQEWICEYLV